MTESTKSLPLHGLRVLELGHIVAGPTASLILADLGADVIKIENPDGGDQARRMPGAGSGYYYFNRNKRSIAIDLKAPLGKAGQRGAQSGARNCTSPMPAASAARKAASQAASSPVGDGVTR